ncbi:MAG: hypothetical protein NT128_01540 [Proteobacteria bacterium]|nr:hypothetical protein [Pseudomonadota bacterium]
MKKFLFSAVCLSISTLYTAEYVEYVQGPEWRETVAGLYYKNASVVGSGTTHRSIHLFLDDKLSNDPTFQKSQFEDDSYHYTFFHRATEKGTEIVLLPFKHKEGGYFQSPTLDKETKIPLYPPQNVQEQTVAILQMLYDRFKNKLVCHFVSHEAPRQPIEKPALTRLGAAVFKIVPLNSDHLNYMRLEFDDKIQQATIFEPASLKLGSRFLLDPHKYKAERYVGIKLFDIPLKISYVYRGDQLFNRNDCGRFSAIYLLYAVNGQDITQLSRYKVYQGFKRWIEGTEGLLSYQKSFDGEAKFQEDFFKDDPKKTRELLHNLGHVKSEMKANDAKLETLIDKVNNAKLQALIDKDNETDEKSVDEKHNSLSERDKELRELLVERKSISERGKELEELFSDSAKEIEQYAKDFPKRRSAATVNLLREIVQSEEDAPPIKKTWCATFTNLFRMPTHWILRYL